MQIFEGKWRYALHAIGIITLCVVGFHSCNVALYNAWQTAFPQNAPYIGQLSLRFWFYGVVAVVALGCAVVALVVMIRRTNRESKSE